MNQCAVATASPPITMVSPKARRHLNPRRRPGRSARLAVRLVEE